MTTPKTHKVEILSTHHSLMIEGIQIDICYLIKSGVIQIFVDGELKQSGIFHPSRLVINYLNLVEVASHVYDTHVRDSKPTMCQAQ